MKRDLEVENNEKLLKTYVDLNFQDEDRENINKALTVSENAQEGTYQKEELKEIPYVNHPIRVATMAIQDLKLSSEA